jgi:hypothetical protein
VTNDDFAARLLRSAEQAAAIKAGAIEPGSIRRRKVRVQRSPTGQADQSGRLHVDSEQP